jgi:hypothetical protein
MGHLSSVESFESAPLYGSNLDKFAEIKLPTILHIIQNHE